MSLADSPHFDLMSRRARNVCLQSEIRTVDDLLQLTPAQIATLKNCGPRVTGELLALQRTYRAMAARALVVDAGETIDTLQKRHGDNATPSELLFAALEGIRAESGTATREMITRFIIPHRNLVARGLLNNGRQWLSEWAESVPDVLWRDARRTLMRALMAAREHQALTVSGRRMLSEAITTVADNLQSTRSTDAFRAMPEALRNMLADNYARRYNAILSVRARNAMRSMDTLQRALPYIFNEKRLDMHDFAHCGKKTMDEFRNFLDSVRTQLEDTFADMPTPEAVEAMNREAVVDRFRLRFPILTDEEVARLVSAPEDDPAAAFEILYAYATRNNDRNVRIICRALNIDGLNADTSYDKLAAEFDVTRERIRQIVDRGFTPEAQYEPYVNTLRRHLDGQIVATYDPRVTALVGGLGPEIDAHRLLALVSAYTPWTQIVRLRDSAVSYMADNAILEGLNVGLTATRIRQIAAHSRRSTTRINLRDFVLERHADRRLHARFDLALPIFADLCRDIDNVDYEDGYIVFKPTRIDLPSTLVEILRDNGRPMRLKELIAEARRRNPGVNLSRKSTFVTCIYNDTRIRAVGRSGAYVLADWENTFTGTIPDFAEMLLLETGRPMHIQEIAERAAEHFPDTNATSVSTLLRHHGNGRFRAIRKGLFGLTALDYPRWESKQVSSDK